MLINAIKDVTTALADLIEATKNASGKPSTDPAMGTLKEAAKVGDLWTHSSSRHHQTIRDDNVLPRVGRTTVCEICGPLSQ